MTDPIPDTDPDDHSQHPSTTTSTSTKNKHLDLDPNDPKNASDESGRSSPFIRDAHKKEHHRSKHDHHPSETNNKDENHSSSSSSLSDKLDALHSHPHSPFPEDTPQTHSTRLKEHHKTGRKIQHGLSSSSSRSTGQPVDCYIGLAFRCLKTEEEVRRYRDQVGGESKSVVSLEEGEELLIWTAVVSDGKLHDDRE